MSIDGASPRVALHDRQLYNQQRDTVRKLINMTITSHYSMKIGETKGDQKSCMILWADSWIHLARLCFPQIWLDQTRNYIANIFFRVFFHKIASIRFTFPLLRAQCATYMWRLQTEYFRSKSRHPMPSPFITVQLLHVCEIEGITMKSSMQVMSARPCSCLSNQAMS